MQGDAEGAERSIDSALASGCEPGAASLLSCVAALRRGDLADAVLALRKPETQRVPRARRALTAALVLFEAQAPFEAVRSALDALSASRAAHDRRGERAALLLLAACYTALGREHDAETLRQSVERLS
jgi:hypothetical protein